MKKIISLSIILIGFTAMASQIIYMRELLIVFYGNELSISLILAIWLIGGAFGSAVLGTSLRVPPKAGRSNPILIFSLCQATLGILLPAGIIASRIIKPALNINPGEIIPLFPIAALSFLILAPICVILGFMFSIACHIHAGTENISGSRSGIAIGNVYILEAIGSIVGGALTSLVLVRFFDALYIMVFFSILNLLAAFLLIRRSSFRSNRETVSPLTWKLFLLLLVVMIAAWFFGGLKYLDQYSLKKQWQGYDLVASKNSIYGNVALVKKGEDFSFFDNGLHLYTIPDRMNSEEAVHLALLEHPDPKDVLLVGGGVAGPAAEVLKYPVKKLDYVELDPLIINMAEKYLPHSYYEALKNPRVSIKNTDGRFFVKRTKEKYDCVIVRVGDPYTAQINRYYTREFFEEVKDILKKGGIISFSLASSESYISRPLGEFLSSVYLAIKDVFADVIVMPGETAYFIASDKKGSLTYDYKILEERTRQRLLDTRYVRDYYMASKLSPEKISYINSVIKNSTGIKMNRDSRPASYYYGLIFWTTLFRDSAFSGILKSVDEHIVWQVIGAFIILLALASILFKRSFKRTALVAVMAGGFSTMAFQILILLAFQVTYGYLFYQLGIILTAFMAGLAIGAAFAVKIIKRIGRERRFLMAVQADLFLFSLILPIFFLKAPAPFLFPVISVIAGFLGGAQFTLVNSILLVGGKEAGRIGGLSYGTDLFGSFLGASLTGVFLIPILGISKTCLAVALINLAALALLSLNLHIEE